MKKLKLLLAAVISAGLLLSSPGAANAAATGTIPYPIGGTYTIELADFQYPVDNGCYQPTASYFDIRALSDFTYDYFVVDLTVRDSIGRVADTFFELESYSGRYPFAQQFCRSFELPGTYTATGVLRFEGTGSTGYGTVSIPISDVYTISAPPAPAPVVTPPAAPSQPAVSNACKRAKAAFSKAKKQNKSYNTIQRLKKKKNRLC